MNSSKEIIDLIAKHAKINGLSISELARRVGVAKSTLSRYINGERDFPINDIGKYAKELNLSVEYLLGVGESKDDTSKPYTYYPTLISAGIPQDVEPITKKQKISISDHVMGKHAGRSDIAFLRVDGDSMDNIIPDGSLIAYETVNDTYTLKNGDIVVYSNDYEYSVKHYYKHNDTLVFKPNSTNPIHHDQTYNIDDNITIHGKVVLYIVNLD